MIKLKKIYNKIYKLINPSKVETTKTFWELKRGNKLYAIMVPESITLKTIYKIEQIIIEDCEVTSIEKESNNIQLFLQFKNTSKIHKELYYYRTSFYDDIRRARIGIPLPFYGSKIYELMKSVDDMYIITDKQYLIEKIKNITQKLKNEIKEETIENISEQTEKIKYLKKMTNHILYKIMTM